MKKILLVFSLVVALALPITAFAASSDSSIATNFRNFCGIGINESNLTEQQKSDLSESFDQMIDLRKDTINKMVQNRTITKEQGELALSRLEAMMKYHSENGNDYGFGMMNYFKGNGMMNSYGGNRMMNSYKN